MRPVLLAGVACALALVTSARAQNVPGAMPGKVVGGYSGQLFPAGQPAPAAAPAAGGSVGQPVGGGLMSRSYDPTKPFDQFKGTGIEPSALVAPVVGADGLPIGDVNYFDKLVRKVKSMFTSNVPAPRNFTPGLTRRTRDRADHTWRRD